MGKDAEEGREETRVERLTSVIQAIDHRESRLGNKRETQVPLV